MGYSLNHIDAPGAPFQVVHEQIVDVPIGGTHTVRNEARKLLFVLSGEARHQIMGWEGPWGDVRLRPGDILALPHRCVQRYSPPEAGSGCRLHVIRLGFDPGLLPPLLPADRTAAPVSLPDAESDSIAWANFALREIRCSHIADDPVIAETLQHLRGEMERRAPGYRPRVHGLCVGLTVLFARSGIVAPGDDKTLRKKDARAGSGPGYHAEKIKAYLRRNLSRTVRLADVAGCIGLTDEHTARLFKQETGQTVFEYVRHLRIAQAKTLLATTEENISEIAHRTGFSSLTVFSRNFTQEVGLPPSEFRRRIARQIG